MGIIQTVLAFLRVLLVGRAALAAENLALRHQLAVLQRSAKRPSLEDLNHQLAGQDTLGIPVDSTHHRPPRLPTV